MNIPNGAALILQRLEHSGFDAYVVGGCVRDTLLGLQPNDWDICTAARPDQIMECFRQFRVLETGLRHGTVTVLIDGQPFEVTTFRVEGTYTDRRHPDSVEFVGNVESDLARRDFTINAMAYSPSHGLIDCFGGQDDLRQGLIRCVGEPDRRFSEDALRLMRALRFASCYGFGVEESTARSVHKNKALLKEIASERIRVELEKLLSGVQAQSLLREFSDVIFTIIPELAPMEGFDQKNPHHIYTAWEHTLHAVAAAQGTLPRLCLLLHDIAKPACCTQDSAGVRHFIGHPEKGAQMAEQILRRLRFDTETIHRTVEIIRLHDCKMGEGKPAVRRWLNRMGEEMLRLLLQVKEADARAQAPAYIKENLATIFKISQLLEEILKEKSCFCLKDLEVKGDDLVQLGIPPGPKLGEILNMLLQKVMEDQISNERSVLLDEAKVLWKKDILSSKT